MRSKKSKRNFNASIVLGGKPMGKVKRELFEENPDTLLPNDFDMLMDNLDIPDVEIEYQEDDGNSNCDGGGCTI